MSRAVRRAYNPPVAVDSLRPRRDGPSSPPGARWWRSPLFGLALLLAADLIAQLFLLDRSWAGNPFLRVPQGDADVYWSWAGAIAAGDWVADEPFQSAPLYPYFLAALRSLGGGLFTVYLIQTLLRTATAALLYALGARMLGRPGWGFAAAGLFLALGEPVFYAHRALNSSLQLLLVAGLLLAAHALSERRSRGRLAGTGLLLGLNLLANPTMLLALPLLPLWLGWRDAAAWRANALVAGCALALVAPSALHNWLATRDSPGGAELILLSAQAGVTYSHGNSAKAYGVYTPMEGVAMERERQNQSAYDVAAAATGKPGWKNTSDYFLRRGLDWVASDPGAALRLHLRKLAWLLAGQYYGDIYQVYQEQHDPVLKPPVLWPFGGLPTGWLILPALAGAAALLARRGRAAGPALVLLALPAAVVIVFWYSPRYRLPIVPAACLLAPLGLAAAARMAPRALGLGLAAALAAATPLLGAALRPAEATLAERDPATVWFDTPALYQPEYERAVGEALMRMYELGEKTMPWLPAAAIERFERCIEFGGEQAIVREYMGNLRVDIGRQLGAPGQEPEARREYEAAIAEYSRAIALNPTRLFAWLGRGATLLHLGRSAEATPDLERALALAREAGDGQAAAHVERLLRGLRD